MQVVDREVISEKIGRVCGYDFSHEFDSYVQEVAQRLGIHSKFFVCVPENHRELFFVDDISIGWLHPNPSEADGYFILIHTNGDEKTKLDFALREIHRHESTNEYPITLGINPVTGNTITDNFAYDYVSQQFVFIGRTW